MDEQGLDGAFLFPTLGVGMEGALNADRPALLAAFHGFNRWLLDDWTFDYQGRLFAAPYLTLADPAWAVEELQFVLDSGARSSTCVRARSRTRRATGRSATTPTIRSGSW